LARSGYGLGVKIVVGPVVRPGLTLLHIDNLTVCLDGVRAHRPILDAFSIRVAPGEVLGLVGESGCGKSTAALATMGLMSPSMKVKGGAIRFEGTDLLQMTNRSLRALQGAAISMIFQDPLNSLNPVHSVGDQVIEAVRAHRQLSRKQALEHARDLLDRVGMPDPQTMIRRYPHQLSGGQRQRVGIAMAIACNPRLIIADEPTTALDLTIQAQILRLLVDMIRETGTSLLLITHDLGVVSEMADRVAVMYAGRIVETGPTETVIAAPSHPYTSGLIAALPSLEAPRVSLAAIPGAPPDLSEASTGCLFAPRCRRTTSRCRTTRPELSSASNPAVPVACHDPIENGDGL